MYSVEERDRKRRWARAGEADDMRREEGRTSEAEDNMEADDRGSEAEGRRSRKSRKLFLHTKRMIGRAVKATPLRGVGLQSAQVRSLHHAPMGV